MSIPGGRVSEWGDSVDAIEQHIGIREGPTPHKVGFVGRDAIDSSTAGLEQNQETRQINDRVKSFESSVGVGLRNMLDRVEVAIQNLTQCMANRVESKQATGAPEPVAQGT